MRNFNFFISVFVLQFCVRAFAQNPYIRHFTTNEGLPTNTIYQMCQDRNKFLWLTSDAGVIKFDGTNFTSYRKKDGLSSNDVVRIKEDTKGRIWFFNYNGTVNYFYNNKIYNGDNAPFLKLLTGQGFILDFFTDSSKTIHFYNYQREVFSLDTNNHVTKDLLFKNIYSELPFVGKELQNIRVSYLGKVENEWIILANCGICRQHIPTGRITFIDSSLYSRAVFSNGINKMYLLYYYFEEKDLLYKVSLNNLNKKENISFPGNIRKIKTIIEDSEGYLWIATLDEGVYCLKNNKIVTRLNIHKALGLLQDHEGNIWVSTETDGIYLINHNILTQNHFDRTYFNNSGVNQLSLYPGVGIWCLNNTAAYLFQNAAIFYKLSVPKSVQPLDFLHLFRNQSLMLGARSTGICVFEKIGLKKGSKEITCTQKVLLKIPIKKVIENRTGEQTALFDQNRFLITPSINPTLKREFIFISERINNAYFNAGNEFVVNGKENYVYRGNKMVPYPELSRFKGTVISDHLVLNDSVELFNIDGDSIYLYFHQRFYNLTQALNSPVNLQIKKMAYQDSVLYLSTLNDIFLCYNPFKIANGNPLPVKPLNISFNNINDFLLRHDSLFIASDDGLTIIPGSSIFKNIETPPIPYFQIVTVNDSKYSLPIKELKLSGKHNIQLHFGCISFFSSAVTYSYLLEGPDNKWTTGTGREIDVFYRNLPPGQYLFKLRVRKSNSDWSKPLILPIIIKPTLFEYPAFWAFLVLLSGVIILLFINRIRAQRMRKIEVDHQLVVLEQKALQSMMNPHFIFNSLGSIQNYLLKNKRNEAVIYLSDFARLIRQNLKAANSPMIKLEEEVERLKNYLELEKIRLENKFDYTIEVDHVLDEDEVFIPGMIIQPIAENSIWHGIATIQEQGKIQISFQEHTPESLKIIIRDNGIGIKKSDEYSNQDTRRQPMGMQMIKKRLDLLAKKYKIRTGIRFTECFPGTDNPGTEVELIVPFTYTAADF